MTLDRSIASLMNEQGRVQTLFVAKVHDNKDDQGLNRVKVTIDGLIEKGDNMPWMAPFRLAPFGAGAQFGVFGSPPIGAELLVYLQGGDINYGFYVAGYQGMSNKHPDFGDPNVWGFADPSGTKLIVNISSKVMVFTHASGIVETYSGSGSYTMFSPEDQTLQARSVNIIANETVSVKAKTIIGESTNLNLSCNQGTVTSSGALSITGNPINLN